MFDKNVLDNRVLNIYRDFSFSENHCFPVVNFLQGERISLGPKLHHTKRFENLKQYLPISDRKNTKS